MIANAQYVLIAGALIVPLFDMLRRALKFGSARPVHILTIAVLLLALVSELIFGNMQSALFGSAQYSYFINGFILSLSVLIFSFMVLHLDDLNTYMDPLFLIAVLGATLTVISSNFLSLIISLEMMTIPSYALVMIFKDKRHLEGAFKYLFISLLSIALLMFGSSLIYLSSGSLSFLSVSSVNYLFFLPGIAVVLAGVSYEAVIVPFHSWAPDTYDAADSTVTAFLSSVLKAAALIAIIHIFTYAFPLAERFMLTTLMTIAIATIIIPSITAISQSKLKRMLIYSSIAQSGFAFVGVSLLSTLSVYSAVFYVFAFATADALVFLSLSMLEKRGVSDISDLGRLRGLDKVPLIGLGAGLLSLAGFPPTIGFFGKLLIFLSLIFQGYTWIVIILIALLLFSTFYYYNVFRNMYRRGQVRTLIKTIKPEPKSRLEGSIIAILTAMLFIGIIFLSGA
ncbi:MAG: proton-conducting transporter membrane subunit [Candidatus Parvarchaeota archaeon]|nr:proton-conducting transporter membrane subunit [Candidatus Parvarchaeota archaeon]